MVSHPPPGPLPAAGASLSSPWPCHVRFVSQSYFIKCHEEEKEVLNRKARGSCFMSKMILTTPVRRIKQEGAPRFQSGQPMLRDVKQLIQGHTAPPATAFTAPTWERGWREGGCSPLLPRATPWGPNARFAGGGLTPAPRGQPLSPQAPRPRATLLPTTAPPSPGEGQRRWGRPCTPVCAFLPAPSFSLLR